MAAARSTRCSSTTVSTAKISSRGEQGLDYAKYLLGRERTGIARVGFSKERIRRIKELARPSAPATSR